MQNGVGLGRKNREIEEKTWRGDQKGKGGRREKKGKRGRREEKWRK